ncbi:MAG TPA: GNAT family N-acetyltransferase [Vicinamibacterales bacterium]|nr:GNAT family N-acetyltransferase [Vicinamibacterales bacterium]
MIAPRGRLRLATAGDVPVLATLMGEFYAEGGYPLPSAQAARTFERLLAAPDRGLVWLMVHEGQPAGFVVLTVSFSMEFGGLRGFVDDLFVAPAFRRRGLASEALEVLKEACHTRGVRALLVETSLDNDLAVRVYRRAGFAENGRLLLTQALAAPVHERDDHG